MQTTTEVFQFKVPMPANPNVRGGGLRYTLVYIVETAQGWVLIDAGVDSDEGFKAFQEQLSQAGIAPSDIKTIVITHGHPDHAGMARRIAEFTGAKVAMHRLDAESPLHPRMHTNGNDAEKTRAWLRARGAPEEDVREIGNNPFGPRQRHDPGRAGGSSAPKVDVLLDDSEELVPGSGLRAVWTPGHTAGHICIHDGRRRLLFSGDHVLPGITPHISLIPGDHGDPLGQFLESHRRLLKLEVDTVHPAHQHSFSDLGGRVKEIMDHHQERMSEIEAQVQDGPRTPWEIASRVHWNVGPWSDLGPDTRWSALMETRAHIRHMVTRGRLVAQEQDSLILYARA